VRASAKCCCCCCCFGGGGGGCSMPSMSRQARSHARPHAHTHTTPPEYYLQGSGVIAVVVYGLYGASSYLYGFSTKGVRAGTFFKFWDVLSCMLNGMIFFFVGASLVNFLLG
jgi:hypothetical protein